MGKWEYFLRVLCPRRLYSYSTKVRMPQNVIDFRKFLIARYVLRDGGSVIDGGSHIGYYTRYFSDIVQGRGKVYSFEPNPYMFRLLHKYAEFHSNISAYQKALSNETMRMAFYVEPFSLSQDSTLKQGRAKQKKISVESVALDDFLGRPENIRLIKLDVEGSEMQAIMGAKELIAHCRPWLIFEYVQNSLRTDRELISLMEKWSYSCLDIETLKEVPREGEISLTDIVAIPAEEQNSFIEALKFF